MSQSLLWGTPKSTPNFGKPPNSFGGQVRVDGCGLGLFVVELPFTYASEASCRVGKLAEVHGFAGPLPLLELGRVCVWRPDTSDLTIEASFNQGRTANQSLFLQNLSRDR